MIDWISNPGNDFLIYKKVVLIPVLYQKSKIKYSKINFQKPLLFCIHVLEIIS